MADPCSRPAPLFPVAHLVAFLPPCQSTECRPDLDTAFNPWDRITTPEAVAKLFHDGGIGEVDVVADNGYQGLRTVEDFSIAMGSGLRWVIDQMGAETAHRVRKEVLARLIATGVDRVETNVIYAVARRERIAASP